MSGSVQYKERNGQPTLVRNEILCNLRAYIRISQFEDLKVYSSALKFSHTENFD